MTKKIQYKTKKFNTSVLCPIFVTFAMTETFSGNIHSAINKFISHLSGGEFLELAHTIFVPLELKVGYPSKCTDSVE